MAKKNKRNYSNNVSLVRQCYKLLRMYFDDKAEKKDLEGVPKDMLIMEFVRQRKELHDLNVEHKIMKRILVEHGLWEELLNDDEFLEFLREDYNGF